MVLDDFTKNENITTVNEMPPKAFSVSAPLFKDRAIREILKDRHIIAKIIPPEKRKLYKPVKLLGRGDFGVVFQAEAPELKKMVAIKRFYETSTTRSREVQVMKTLSCPHCPTLIDHFYAPGNEAGSRYVFVVTDLYPSNVRQELSSLTYPETPMPSVLRKLFAFRIFAGLSYLHGKGIIHRDISASNTLVDPVLGLGAVNDFGSSKFHDSDEESLPYMGDRCNRAPELILGHRKYTAKVDIWAAGCVFAEMLRGRPLFEGVSQFHVLYAVLETLEPVDEEVLRRMRGKLGVCLPRRQITSLERELPLATKSEIAFLRGVLQFDPSKRMAAQTCLRHQCFDELFNGTTLLPNRTPIPVLERGFDRLATRPKNTG